MDDMVREALDAIVLLSIAPRDVLAIAQAFHDNGDTETCEAWCMALAALSV